MPRAIAEINDGRLVRLLDEWTPVFPGFYIYYSSRRYIRPALRAFVDYFSGPTNPLSRR
jgi:DNA-binding transcriptional LysR family regulator